MRRSRKQRSSSFFSRKTLSSLTVITCLSFGFLCISLSTIPSATERNDIRQHGRFLPDSPIVEATRWCHPRIASWTTSARMLSLHTITYIRGLRPSRHPNARSWINDYIIVGVLVPVPRKFYSQGNFLELYVVYSSYLVVASWFHVFIQLPRQVVEILTRGPRVLMSYFFS